jgi:SAM-dependent methyltransferase
MNNANPRNPEVFDHYDQAYFDWQEQCGKIGGWANQDKYRSTVGKEMRVLDFGCGGGFLLSQMDCKERFGIEPNPAARQCAAKNGLTMFAGPDEALTALGPNSLDLIISDNALEHALEPWRALQALLPLLKPGGKLHFYVPCENISWRFKQENIDQHMYSWSPQSIGNLAKAAGFSVIHSRPYVHKWPPKSHIFAKMGRPVFNAAARIWGQIDRRWFQVELLAEKPKG